MRTDDWSYAVVVVAVVMQPEMHFSLESVLAAAAAAAAAAIG